MSNIPFFIIFTKPNKHKIETIINSDKGTSLNDVKNKLIYLIQEELSTISTLPENYNDLLPIWYSNISADSEPFDYKIFNDGDWCKPWTLEELYDGAYEVLYKLELIEGYINTENKNSDEEWEEVVN
jgi:hypothetical protein